MKDKNSIFDNETRNVPPVKIKVLIYRNATYTIINYLVMQFFTR